MEYERVARQLAGPLRIESDTERVRSLPPRNSQNQTRLLRSQIAVARNLRGSNARPISSGLPELMQLPVPSWDRLRDLFDLTPAEARLAQALAQGRSLEESSRFLDVKISTARTQLASIFTKTNTSRQGKLIAILCRVAHIG